MKYLRPILFVFTLLFHAPALVAAEPVPGTSDSGASLDTVVEVIEVPNYTYLRLEERNIWVAVPTFPVSVGDRVEYTGGTAMGEFYSKTLDRTFESIFFISNVKVVGKNVDSLHRAVMEGYEPGTENIVPANQVSIEAPAPGEITRLDDGKSIAEIYSEATELSKQTVKLRAKVMKVSKNVSGRNWITLNDGTGSGPEAKLLATSSELVSPGELVIAVGTVGTDIDIGSGYSYKVLLENTVFTKSLE
jgi:hypothetical protein